SKAEKRVGHHPPPVPQPGARDWVEHCDVQPPRDKRHQRRVVTYALLGLAAALAGIATAVCGIVVFVGLVASHLARRLTGPMNRRVLPAAALIGALIVAGADLFGRTIAPPTQLPAGLICGLIGAPFFFLLMRRHHG
ncbi:MAG: iron chelate uptake ABC transporter family permease subunit, partial [Pseudomonadota bacterium]